MQSLFSFLKSRQFLIHLGIILGVVSLCLFITHRWMSSYTGHGEFVEVPQFKGLEVKKLDEFIKGREVTYKIIDSLYDPRQKSGIVLRQDPDSGSKVKHNRTVYLYVTGMVAPQIAMPKLVDLSERQARLIIETYGLRKGNVSEQAADCNGCVISQRIKGREIEPGKPVKKGSVVDLVIGRNERAGAATPDTLSSNEPVDFDKQD